MKQYLHNLRQKPTHERRQHALRAAGVVTGSFLVLWLGTLGVRLAAPASEVAGDNTSLTASVSGATQQGGNQLVSTPATQ